MRRLAEERGQGRTLGFFLELTAALAGDAALATAALAVFLPMPLAEATITATMLSIAIYACIVLWVFATRSAWRAWAGIALPALVLYALLWLRQLLVGT